VVFVCYRKELGSDFFFAGECDVVALQLPIDAKIVPRLFDGALRRRRAHPHDRSGFAVDFLEGIFHAVAIDDGIKIAVKFTFEFSAVVLEDIHRNDGGQEENRPETAESQ